jgi:hypothetical protein
LRGQPAEPRAPHLQNQEFSQEPEDEKIGPQSEDKERDEEMEQQQLKEQLYATMLGSEEVERSKSLNLRFLKEDRA